MANAPRSTLVKSQTRGTAQPIKVVAGETTVFPFGPPYKAEVALQVHHPAECQGERGDYCFEFPRTAGEQITSLIVDGGIPMKPAFTITDPDGKEFRAAALSMAEVSLASTRGEYPQILQKNITLKSIGRPVLLRLFKILTTSSK